MTPLCLSCGKRKANLVPPYGYLPCKVCVARQKKYRVRETIENTTDSIKEDRQKYRADIYQRYMGDTVSLEYIKKYGTKGFTPEEVKKAKNVTGEYYSDKTEKFDPKSVVK